MRLHLIPEPRQLKLRPGRCVCTGETRLWVDARVRNLFEATDFVEQVQRLTQVRMRIAMLPAGRERIVAAGAIRARLDDGFGEKVPAAVRGQAYRLTVAPTGIDLVAQDEAGLFYGFQTLLQIVREVTWERLARHKAKKNQESRIQNQKSFTLPALEISDYPDFARRGFYHDTARGKVPKVETLLQLIDDLAHLKYNEFQLYIENNFQFRKHPAMYDDTDPLTAGELRRLDVACRERHIDFVPSLTSLGHFEKILWRPRYRGLAEAEPAQLKAIGAPCWHEEGPWSLCVTDPRAKKLLAEMYDEFAPCFSSGQFNICCDEAYDLGRVRSKKLADKIGVGQMYVDWIKFCDRLVKSHGKEKAIQMWGDIILKYPELITQLPADATLLEWGYEHDHKFDEHCEVFSRRLRENAKDATLNAERGTMKTEVGMGERGRRSFYVAPGTSSWLTLSARTKNACGNIHAAARAGMKHGARGMLVTDWGDQGHQQMLAVSLVPLAYGAGAGWNWQSLVNPAKAGSAENSEFRVRNSEWLRAASLHLFRDPSGKFAFLGYELGLTYERLGWQRFNASLDHFLFREKWDFANYVNRAPAQGLARTLAATEKLRRRFGAARLLRADAAVIREEFVLTCREIEHTCARTQLRQAWLAADPAVRNPEEPTRRDLPARRVGRDFGRRMKAMRGEVRELAREFARLWLARNKRSRLDDVLREFERLEREYGAFAGG